MPWITNYNCMPPVTKKPAEGHTQSLVTKLSCLSTPVVYSPMPNFSLIGTCHPVERKQLIYRNLGVLYPPPLYQSPPNLFFLNADPWRTFPWLVYTVAAVGRKPWKTTILATSCTHIPIDDKGHVRVGLQWTLPNPISPWSVYAIAASGQKAAKIP